MPGVNVPVRTSPSTGAVECASFAGSTVCGLPGGTTYCLDTLGLSETTSQLKALSCSDAANVGCERAKYLLSKFPNAVCLVLPML